jgi:hypothetical protein
MSDQFPVYSSQIRDPSYTYRDLTPVRPTYEREIDPSLGGWISAIGDAVVMQPMYQNLYENLQIYTDFDPNYDPLSEDNLRGYEAFSSEFIGIRSKQEQDFIKNRITNNLRRRTNVERELGLGGLILSEVFNPVNYIPIPGIMGANFGIKTLAKATTVLGGSLVGEEMIRQRTDPTATTQESIDNVVYGTLFGALLIGGLGAATKVKRTDQQRWTDELVDWADFKRADASNKKIDEEAIIFTDTDFEARPTGQAPTGVAQTFLKIEKLTGMTFVGRMLNSGIRSV